MKIIRPLMVTNTNLTSSNVSESDYAAHSLTAVYNTADRVTLISPAATATISVASPALVTQTAHGLTNGTPVYFTTTGALPTGIVANTIYYIVNRTTNTYRLSATVNGTALTTTGSQSGTHTATAQLHKVYESLTGSQSTVTMTIAAPCVVTWTAHGRAANDPISFTTTGALPTGLVAGTVYYVLSPTANTFNVSATAGGAAITTTGSQSGVHTATSSLNYNQQPNIATTYWIEVGATNRWRCFDQSISSQTTNADTIVNVITAEGIVDSVVFLNVDAVSYTITQTDITDGVVVNTTGSLVADSGILDWWAWSFEPVIRITDKVISGLLPYANSAVSITLTDTGGTPKCGGMIVGLSKDVSYVSDAGNHVGTELGIKVGTQDYSVKQRSDFGDYTILERGFSKRANWSVFVESTYVDALQNLLASYRATPVVYVGSGDYGSSIIYGFYKDFDVDIAYHTKSVCTISLEGLT